MKTEIQKAIKECLKGNKKTYVDIFRILDKYEIKSEFYLPICSVINHVNKTRNINKIKL